MSAISGVLIGQALGRLIAFAWFAVDDKLRAHYQPKRLSSPLFADTARNAVIYYDKSFISSLKF